MFADRRARLLTGLSLAVLYVVWGSTYLAQHVALRGFAPFQMAALRFTIAGGLLLAICRARGAKMPTRPEWRAAVVTALPLLVTGMGLAAVGIQRVPSGLAALVFGSVPLSAAVFDRFWGGRLARIEILGLAVGFAGVAVVSLRGGLAGDPAAALVLLAAATSYALGAVCTRRLPSAPGLVGTGAQMLVGGLALGVVSLLRGESMTSPSASAVGALVYLVVFGSLVAYSAFGYLLRTTRTSLATSYAYVNPVVALLLGALVGGERVSRTDLGGLALVLVAVALVAIGARAKLPRAHPRVRLTSA